MSKVFVFLAALGTAVALVGWPTQASAYDTFYDANCAQCHGPVRTCGGCHAHGTHSLANKADFGVYASANKATFVTGEDVVVSVTGGYRPGWVRMLLLDQNQNEVARSSGPGGLGNGADESTPGGIVLRAPAPSQPGTYTWYAAWYGNKFDLFERNGTPTSFGPMWKDGPGASHGRELVPVTFSVMAGGPPVAALSSPSLAFPRVAAGATTTLTTQIQNTGTGVLKVSSIGRCATGSNPFSWSPAAPFNVAPGTSAALTVTYQPLASQNDAGCLQITTNAATPVTQLTVTGAADPAPVGTPAVGASLLTIDFGTGVNAGTYVMKTFDVQSLGTANLDVTSIAACAGASSAYRWTSPLPGTIAPAESRTVTVYYTPTAAGTNRDCLILTTSGGTINVTLTGSAVVPPLTCTSCHGATDNTTGAPPTDTAGNTETTRRSVGAHTAHLNTQISPTTAQQAQDCTSCHESVKSFTDPLHNDGSVDVPFGGVAKAGGANPSWNPQTPTCGTTYCHGATMQGGTNTSPTWTNVGANEAACGKCHGVPPDSSTGHPTVTGGLTACASCHPETMTSGGTIDPAGKHINGIVEAAGCTGCHGSSANPAPPKDTKGNTVTTALGVGAHQQHVAANPIAAPIACSECHGAASASYTSGHSNGVVDISFGQLANQGTSTTWTRASATCATSYCHGGSGAVKGGSAITPVWTTVDGSQATCGSCHGLPPPASSGHPTTASSATACASCHPGTVNSDGTINLAGGLHLNGAVDVANLTCTSCHGTAGRTGSDPFIAAAPPSGTKGETATTTRAVGAHMAHLSAGTLSNAFACTDCHNPPTTTTHSNGVVEMSFSALAKGTGTPAWNGTTCASTYCHGNFKNGNTTNAPVWTGGAAQVACNSCHGSPPAGTHPTNSACGQCHSGYTATTVNVATHVNGLVDTTLTCTSCHGTTGVNAAPPADTKGGTATTLVSVGAHQAHATTALRSPIDCTECHGAAVSTYTNTHSNNTVDISFGAISNTGTTSVWSHTAATCASNYCHGGSTALKGGTATTPLWTKVDGTQKTCASCHGNPPPSSSGHVQRTDCGSCHTGYTNTSVNVASHINGVVDVIGTLTCTTCHGSASLVAVAGADANVKAAPPVDTSSNSATTARGVGVHTVHVNGSRSKPVACAECHSGAVPTSSTHANGVVTVAFGTLAKTGGAAPAYSTTALSCATAYCHGTFSGGTPATPVWTSAGTLACTACHGNPPALPHPQDTSCADCHGAGYSQTTVVASTHVDGAVTLAATRTGCTQCHGDGTRTAIAGADANTPAAPPIGSKGETVTTARAVGAHVSHLNQKTFRATPIACTECHAVPAAGDKTHANGTAAITFGTLAKTGSLTPAWNTTALTCASTYCHGGTTAVQGGTNTTPTWTGTFTAGTSSLGCTSCHGAPPTANGHPQRTDCGSCHTGATNTAYNSASHINGVVDVIATLSCTTCHGSATLVAVTGADTNVKAAPPVDSKNNSATTAVGVGVHQAHVNGSRSKPVACAECHSGAVPTTPQHENGVVTVAFGTLAKTGGITAAAYTAGGGSCAATYCHGNFTGGAGAVATPTWVTAGTLGCTSCHGSPPALPHPQDTSCADCHGTGYSTTTVVASTHIDGVVTLNGTTHVAGSCTACHGDNSRTAIAGADANTPAAPPIGSKGETATTARAVGAHVSHLNQKTFRATPIACTECHAVPAAGNKTHADGTAAIIFGTLAKTGAVTPSWNTTALTCATVYCHGGTTAVRGGTNTTPTWTGTFTAGSSSLGCTSCHGDPPTSPHPQNNACSSCHTGYGDKPASGPQTVNATLHLNGVLDVQNMTCTSCHGNASLVAVAGADANVQAAPPVDSKGNSVTTAQGVGVHQVHVNGSRSRPVACSDCHAGAVPTSTSHADGVVTVAFAGVATTGAVSPSYALGGGSCSATYCHGNFSGGAGAAGTPTWVTAGTLGCTACHGNPPALPHPQDTSCADCHGAGYSQTTVNAATHVDGAVTLNGTTHVAGSCTACHGDNSRTALASADANVKAAPPIGSKGETVTTARAVGAHVAHLNQTTFRSAPLACTECHAVPAAGNKTHADGTAAIAFGTLARTGSLTPAYSTTAFTCASTYCHGSFNNGANATPTWTGTFTAGASSLGCTSCHGDPPGGTHPTATTCSQCHTGYGDKPASGPQTINAANHMNGAIDVANLTCTSCHGNAALVAVTGADANVKAAPPVDSKGNSVTTAAGVGVHQAHVNGSRSKPVACAECHPVPTSTVHSDGVTQVAFGTLAKTGGVTPAAYVGPGASCSATYCHGNFTGGAGTTATPTWVTAGTLGCTSCHGSPPALPHPQDTACADCHGAGYSQTTVVASTHVDGVVTLNGTTHVAGSCTACHGDNSRTALASADANVKAAPPIGSKGETVTTARAVGAHVAHLNQTTFRSAPLACTECHTVPAAGDKTHANGTAAITFGTLAKTGSLTPAWNTTGLTCASTYCHGGTTALQGGTNTTPTWTGTFTGTSSLTCTSCHGAPPTANGHPQRTDCGSCHTGATNTAYNSANHINGVVDVISTLSCTTCHGNAALVAVTGADTNVKAAPPIDSKNNSVTTAVGVGVHQTHVNGSRSKPVACAECHSGAVPTSPQHENGVVTVAFGTLAKTGGITTAAYTAGGGSCAATYCHGNFTGGAGTTATPTWVTAGTLGCTTCHGSPPALPHPQDTACADCHGAGYSQTTVVASTHVDGAVTLNGTTHVAGSCTACHGDNSRTALASADANVKAAPPIGSKGETVTTARAVGAHVAHLNQTTFRSAPLACTECHTVPAAGDKTHANGTAAITFGTLAKTGTLTPVWSGTTCASVYCHGGTTALNGGTLTTPTWAGTYTAGTSTLTCTSCHGAPPTANGHPQRTDCGTCHTGATNTAYNSANHINGAVDVISTLSCTTCHGNAALVAVAGADTNVKAAPPIDSKNNSVTTAVGVGVHQTHVNGSRSKPVACAECHSGAVPTSPQHENGVVTVAFGTLAKTGGITTAAYTAGGGSCAATYCHGNFTGGAGTTATPTWVTAGTLGCTTCHGNPPALPHPQDTSCADCHGTGYSQTTVVASTHVDGVVTLNGTTHVAGSCTACHGDNSRTAVAGADTNVKASPPIGSKGETVTTARAVGAHASHVNLATDLRGTPIACSECHAVPAAGDKTHANGTAAVTFGTLAKTGGITTAAWNTTALTCASTYCHGNFNGGKKTNAPVWTGTSQAACGTCHSLPPTATEDPNHPAVAAGGSCSGCHTGYNATTAGGTVNLTNHMNGVVDATGGESAGGAACSGCHGTIYNSMIASSTKVSKHTLGSDAAADITTTAWTGTNLAAVATTGRSCVSMCHSDHPHGTTSHNANVYMDATTSTTRGTTKLATDFDSTQTTGGLCTSCHQKPVDAASPAAKPAVAKATFQNTAHDFKSNTVAGTTYTWQYTLHDSSAFQRDCTKCHASQVEGQTPTVSANGSGTVGPHSSDFGSLLAGNTVPGTTPANLICYNCHGNGTVGKDMSGKTIYTDAAKAQGHGTKLNSATVHNTATESATTYNSGAYSGTNRHVVCLDCHDEHMAGKVKHTVGPNDGTITASSPLYGASGVAYTGTLPANWTAIPSTNLAKVAVATAEYQICFKCHTGWAFGTTPPTGTSTLVETDLAQEFNVNNKAAHPVVNTLANQTGSTAKGLAATQLLAPWNTSPGAQTMTCSDCHNTDAASTAAQGPHGSAVTFMLTGVNKAWPYTVAGAITGTVFRVATSETGINTVNGLFCRNCHPQQNSTGSNSLHRNSNITGGQHGNSSAVAACTGCHLRIPHGGKVSRLIVTTNAPARYKIGTSNFASITKGATKDSYSASGFPTGFKSSCGQHSSGTGNEAW